MSLWRKRQLNIGEKMTRDDIIRMAQQSGLLGLKALPPNWYTNGFEPKHIEWLIEFAALVAAEEREACAEACESDDWNVAAAMVRARRNK
jgi:hypothetical protein